ncbi:hypothetical protein KKH59_00115 [Patescibacteria group bacterium]|nr:hypothetical protein [Patescibacteria group bacterium]
MEKQIKIKFGLFFSLICAFFFLFFSSASAATINTSLTLSADVSNPAVGDSVNFSGLLTWDGMKFPGKNIELSNSDTGFVLAGATTDADGKYTVPLPIPCGETFKVKAKYAGETIGADTYLPSASSPLTITPASLTGQCATQITLNIPNTSPSVGVDNPYTGRLINASNGNILPSGAKTIFLLYESEVDLLSKAETTTTGDYSNSFRLSCNDHFSVYAQYIEETINGIEYLNSQSSAIAITPAGGNVCPVPASKTIVSSPLQNIAVADFFYQTVTRLLKAFWVPSNFFVDGSHFNTIGVVKSFTKMVSAKKHEIYLEKETTGKINIIQRIEYLDGKNYYTQKWDIKNISGGSLNNLRIKTGIFPNINGASSYIIPINMISVWDSNNFIGSQSSINAPSNSYAASYPNSNYIATQMQTNADFANFAGTSGTGGIAEAIGWYKATLADQETWSVKAYQYFKTPSYSVVIPPFDDDEKAVSSGGTLTYKFTIINTDTINRTFNLSAASKENFPITITDGADNAINSVSLNYAQYVQVLAKVETKATASDYDIITLTATDSINTNKKNSDFITVNFLPTCTLSVDPDMILKGKSADLVWTTVHAVSAIINNGIGPVAPVSSGSKNVVPMTETNYALTASGAGGSISCQAKAGIIEPLFGGLIPCSRLFDNPVTSWNDTAPCNLCFMFQMIKNILDFITKLAVGITVFILVIAGLLYAFSAGDTGRIETAKQAMTYALIGLAVIFIAWLIINVILATMGYTHPLGGQWSIVDCSLQ